MASNTAIPTVTAETDQMTRARPGPGPSEPPPEPGGTLEAPAPDKVPAAPSRKPRDAMLDNAKFLLITLVVLGHAVSPTEHGRLGSTVYVWIYLFHMPAFVLISGYLSKSFDGSRRRIDKLLTTVAAPYLIFWTLYALQAAWADREVPSGPLEPVFLTWFLAALFVWRITTPLWRHVPWPIPVSIVISLVGGFAAMGEVMEMARVVSLLPFFVVGLYLKPEHFEWLKRAPVRAAAAVFAAATVPMTYFYIEPASREWLYWRESLLDRDFPFFPYGIPTRAVFLVLAFALTAALISLIPRRQMWFTRLGGYTMYVFLLHGLVIRLGEQFGWYEFTDNLLGNRGAWALNAVLAIVAVFVLCSPWVRKATGWAVEPKLDWLLRRRDAAATEPRREVATEQRRREPVPTH